MSMIRPFRALRPVPSQASFVAAVPYDVVNREEAYELARYNEFSFLHISRPEINLPLGSSPYSEVAYELAIKKFEELKKKCPLIQEEEPLLYIYQLCIGSHTQTGIAGCFSIDEYDSNIIKKHERTRPEKENDRAQHISKLRTQSGPVFLTFRDVEAIDSIVGQIQKETAPLYDFLAEDKTRHTVWKCPSSDQIVEVFARQVKALYIADGHHRAAAASRVRKELADLNSKHNGTEDYNFMMAVAFPASQLQILPYYRVVKDLNGLTSSEFLAKIDKVGGFEVHSNISESPLAGEFGMYLEGRWYRLRPKTPSSSNNSLSSEQLDVVTLQDSLLNPILGIGDPRTDARIDFVGGIRGQEELEKLVQAGKGKVAFSLSSTRIEQVMETADRGDIMPPKSTWFEPKLRDGLFCHLF